MKIVVICGMQDYKVRARLKPIIDIGEIEEILLIRRRPVEMPKVKAVSPPGWMRKILVLAEIYRFLSLIWICLIKNVQVLYAIYFVPHGIYAAVAGILFHKRVIQELIGTDRPKVMSSRLFLWLLKQAERIGIRGTSSRKQLLDLGVLEYQIFSPIAVNALDFELFKPDNREKIYDLIYCGRLEEVKQVDVIIRSIGVLKETHPSLKAVFIGDGTLREELQSLTEDLGLGSTIFFAGDQPNKMIPEFLNQSRVFVMASAFEGLPVAMLEALSCGLPVVVPDIGDIGDVAVDGKNACLVNKLNTEEIVSCLDRILSNEDYYQTLGEGALSTRELFKEEYSHQRAQRIWESVLIADDRK